MTLDTALPMRSSIDGPVNLCDSHFVTDSKRIPRPRDPNQLAKLIADIATGQQDDRILLDDGRDALAVMMGRRGGLKGGRARADALSSDRRSEIARAAAAARWVKNGRN